jgi:hypothetical protein
VRVEGRAVPPAAAHAPSTLCQKPPLQGPFNLPAPTPALKDTCYLRADNWSQLFYLPGAGRTVPGSCTAVVLQGDTLATLAAALGYSPGDWAAANQGANLSALQAGQVLNLPSPSCTSGVTAT